MSDICKTPGGHFTRYGGRPHRAEKLIVLGPFSGGYGHFFCQYLTALAGIRERNPNAFIIASAAHVFEPYIMKFADRMYGFDHNWGHTKPAASVSDGLKVNPDLTKFRKYVEQDFGNPDEYFDTLVPNNMAHNLYISLFGDKMKLIRDKEYNPESDLILVWGRMKKGSDWRNGNAKQWRQTIRHLQSRGFRVGICGSRGTSMFFDGIDGVVDYTDYEDVERGRIINEALQEARCCLVDMSGTICECYLVGCPVFVYNYDPRHEVVIPRRNIFGTREDKFIPKPWPHWQQNPMKDGDMSFMGEWLKRVDKFIDTCYIEEPWEKDVASGKGVFAPL